MFFLKNSQYNAQVFSGNINVGAGLVPALII